MPHSILQQSYGKCSVRLTKVMRAGGRHSIIELTADVELDGDFDAAYSDADNRLVVPTDTMKNTVYALARQHDVASIESFGELLAEHFSSRFDHVTRATVRLSEQPWWRIEVGRSKHDHAFLAGGSERFTAQVTIDRGSLEIVSGLDDLTVLKTTGSGFSDFLRDEYTTLKETDDRIFATTIAAQWSCGSHAVNWTQCRQTARHKLLETFATHDSKSVQHTLYAMASAVLDVCSEVQSITLKMPNQHRLLVNLEPFGLDNPNEIFVPTSEPYGIISATIKRESDG